MSADVKRLKIELAKTSKALEVAKLEAVQAKEQARDAQAKETLLRKALGSLGTKQLHAVFAKNAKRQFIFANDILLKGLAPIAKQNGFALENGRAKWEDVYLKTDKDLQIDCEDYKRSDDIILAGKEPYFEGPEETFDASEPEGTVIWTCKEPIREGDTVIGLIGYAVPGLPIEIQKLTDFLFSKLPIYASIKNDKGHIIWANDKHLKKLKGRIDELLKKQKRKKCLKYPLLARLRAINNNTGPTDEDLYGIDGLQYRQRDQDIIARARAHTGDEEAFESEIEDLIRKWYKHERDGKYPDKGWMEFHRFPGEENARWVEVWKFPWWEEVVEHEHRNWRVKGVLVFFEDRHKHFLRKSVIWRWIETHLKRANEASVGMLGSALHHGTARPEQLLRLSAFGLPRMLRRMLIWFKAFVDETQEKVTFSQRKRTTNDLALLLKAVEESYSNGAERKSYSDKSGRVAIRYYPPNPHVTFESHGDDLFAIIIALAMNAVEATLRSGIDPFPPVTVRLQIQKDTVVASVSDEVQCPGTEELNSINDLKALKADGEPGGGFFLAKRLAMHLSGLATKGRFPPEQALVIRKSQFQGAEALLRLPSSVLKIETVSRPRNAR